MAFKILVVLIIVFSAFSWMIYAHCDDNSREGVPGQNALAGWRTWQEKNCQACHQLYGLGGYMGPDLTNVYSENGKGPGYMAAIIKHGTARMPDFHFTDQQTNDLISFLAWVDKSGKTRVSAEQVHWTGTYDLDKTH